MSDAIPNDQSSTGHLIDPPIIDFLAHDPTLKAFVAEFIPETAFSNEMKESVYIYDDTDAARRTREWLAELASACDISAEIIRVAHGGRGNFSFYTSDGQMFQLHDSPSPRHSMEAYAVLQTLSQEIQWEFIKQHRQRKAI